MLKKIVIFTIVLTILLAFIQPFISPSTSSPIQRELPAMDIEYETTQAYYFLNEIRSKLHMITFRKNLSLQNAATSHANYLVKNREKSHFETEGTPNFTGYSHLERTLHHGYLSRHSSENLSTQSSDALTSVESLFSAIYHRFGFLNTTMDEIGIGIVQDEKEKQNNAFVYVMGNQGFNAQCSKKSRNSSGKYWKLCKDESKKIWDKAYTRTINMTARFNPEVIVYPYNKQSEVPPVFYDESPDPLPNYEVSGFPVSISFNPFYFSTVSLEKFKLYDNNNNEIEAKLLNKENDPNQRFTAFEFALMPLKRLAYASEYHAEATYTEKKKSKTLKWHFKTKKFTEPFFHITTNIQEINIEPNSSNIIYFEPHNAHDLLINLTFPSFVYINFIDHNTIRLTVDKEASGNFTIHNKNREITVIINN